MEHPFIGSLETKTLEEIQVTLSDLTKKLNFAYRSQNRAMIQQLQMAIETYKGAYMRKIDDAYKKQGIKTTINVSGKNSP